MKTFTKLISLLIAVMMVFALALPTFAADEVKPTYTLTINGQYPDHVYEAYQVFKGDYAEFYVESINGAYYKKVADNSYVKVSDGELTEDNYNQYVGGVKVPSSSDEGETTYTYTARKYTKEKILSNIKWGDGIVDPEKFLEDLKTSNDPDLLINEKNPFAECNGAEDVARVLREDINSNSTQIDAFAKIVAANLAVDQKHVSTPVDGTTYQYKISGLEAGYYFVKDRYLGDNVTNTTYTKYMLDVVGNLEIEAKADKPTLDKYIIDENGNIKENVSANVGEIIDYKLVSNVPKMDGYKEYTFKVTDTMTKGLTFRNDVKITIGGEVVPDNEYTVNVTKDANGTKIEINMIDFLANHKNDAGKEIVITYSATVNADAVLGEKGNPNTATLEYSKDPNDPTKPTGTTPGSTTRTYVTKIDLTKVDDEGKALTGATFTITGYKTIVSFKEVDKYVEAADGEYYKLKDGTYTKDAPNGNDDFYESTTAKYKLVKERQRIEEQGEWVNETLPVGSDGKLTFTGLGAGEYTITEIVAPDGYNKLEAPIEIKITCTENENGTCTWKVTDKSGNEFTGDKITVDEDGFIKIIVENKKGSLLPSTGGIGTTIFYVLGGILAVGAVVLLVTKKRMREDV